MLFPFQGQDSRNLGKQLTKYEFRQHNTSADYLHHRVPSGDHSRNSTVYQSDYAGTGRDDSRYKRRFPKMCPSPRSGLAKLTTSTTSAFKKPDVPYHTPTQVLATSQEPFLPPNKWKYSYHGLSKCYPAYNIPASGKAYQSWASRHSSLSNKERQEPSQEVQQVDLSV